MNSHAIRAHTGARQEGVVPVPADFFVTSPAATRALLSVEKFPGTVWEPACGDGTMAKVIATQPDVGHVYASDLVDRGYGQTGVDFLKCPKLPDGVSHVVTNPPFELANEFVLHALHLEPPGKVAMFLRLVWLEGSRRRRWIWDPHPPARVWVFSRRQELARNGNGNFQSGLIAFAWFVWEGDYQGPPTLGWL